jgi:hypothetical protein
MSRGTSRGKLVAGWGASQMKLDAPRRVHDRRKRGRIIASSCPAEVLRSPVRPELIFLFMLVPVEPSMHYSQSHNTLILPGKASGVPLFFAVINEPLYVHEFKRSELWI